MRPIRHAIAFLLTGVIGAAVPVDAGSPLVPPPWSSTTARTSLRVE
jgi:hypothetical protein